MPSTDYCGYDSFDYDLTSGNLTSSATVTIHVLCESLIDCPVEAVADEAIVLRQDSHVMISPLSNDACDGYENRLFISSTTHPSSGAVEIPQGGQSIKYTPNPGLCTDSADSITDIFWYTAQNELDSSDSAKIYVDICCSCGPGVATTGEATAMDNETVSATSSIGIAGAAAGAILTLAGTMVFMRKKRQNSGIDPDVSGTFVKTVYSSGEAEGSSPAEAPRDVQLVDSPNLSAVSFLTGVAKTSSANQDIAEL